MTLGPKSKMTSVGNFRVVERRRFLSSLGIGAGAVTALSLAKPRAVLAANHAGSSKNGESAGAAPVGSAVEQLFGELRVGSRLDRWTVVAIHDVHAGAIPVVLETEGGARFQVDVLRRDPAGAEGVASTPSLSLFLANRGDGALASREEHGLGAMALATALGTRERDGAPVPQLLTLGQRLARHPRGVFHVLGGSPGPLG